MFRKSLPNPSARVAGATSEHTGYLQNHRLFSDFYSAQKDFVIRLAQNSNLVRAWLDSLPLRDDTNEGSPNASHHWRMSRLSATRQRELSALVTAAEVDKSALDPLIDFLLKALPVSVYFQIADQARPNLQAIDPSAAVGYRELIRQRDKIFHANYGFARKAVAGRRPYDELLSAASCGLIEAIDRYVPDGGHSSRFAYFASFWVRYHMSRYTQKTGGTVSLSINQQRIAKSIDRYIERRRKDGLPTPSETEVCADLGISAEAYYWYLQRPIMVSLDSFSPGEDEHGEPVSDLENLIATSEPNPDKQAEDSEIAEYLRDLLRKNLPGQRRVMLSYARRIGNLADALEDYLSDLESLALRSIRPLSAGGRPILPLELADDGREEEKTCLAHPGAGSTLNE